MYEDAKNFLTTKFLQVNEVFTPASAYGQMLTVLIDLGKLIFYYVEDSISEMNLYTATRDSSIRSLARIAGHNPTRAICASGTVNLTYNGATIPMYGNTLVIPNYTKLTNSSNGLTYTLVSDSEEVRLTLEGTTSIEVKLLQGVSEAQTVTGDGEDLQSFSLNAKAGFQIDNFHVIVYVNGQVWQTYDSLYDIPYNKEGVLIKTGINGGLDVFFGNTYFGKPPEAGSTIRIEYFTTSGAAGNILEGDIAKFTISDAVYDTKGTAVDGNTVVGISINKPVIFGTDREPIILTRILAPKTSRAYVLGNTDSYVYFLEKFNIFSVVDAFNTLNDDDITDDNVVYLFLIPDVNKRKPVAADYFSTPIELFKLSTYEQDRIYSFIEESGQKIMNTVIKIIEPIIKRYIININIAALNGYSKDTIRQAVISKCSDYFLKNRRRDRIPKSDLISIIESVEGVDSVNVWFVSEENENYRKLNPKSIVLGEADKGIDAFGDIIIGRGEYPLIRGGWENRFGYVYADSTNQNKPGSINIGFGKDTNDNLNMSIHRINIGDIKNT